MELEKKKNKRVSQIFSVDIDLIKKFKKICIDKEVKYSLVLEEFLKDYINKESKESKKESFIPAFFN